MSKILTVIFIRHAEQKPDHDELTLSGFEQAHRRVNLLEKPDLIVHSIYPRSRQTAEALIQRFPKVPVKVWPVEEFHCLSSKNYHGKTSEEWKPAVEKYYGRADPDYVDGEGAESFAEFVNRARETRRKIEVEYGDGLQNICVFTHGQFMRLMRMLLLNPKLNPKPQLLRDFLAYRQTEPLKNTAYFRSQFDGTHWAVGDFTL